MLRLSVFDMVRILVLSMCIEVKKIDSESCSRNGYWVVAVPESDSKSKTGQSQNRNWNRESFGTAWCLF